ncbi:MAG: glycine cleavage system aminomethyltransferase GcvT [Bacteroidetes bacterium]|nr:glycine cleavage system aminomethyltransferase GcvT [Bacteroidota bacterium]
MKQTPLTEKHRQLGAKMAEFAGYEMPIVYTGINDEHQAVREAVGLFDVSHMGEFILKGPNAADLIQRVTSNDVYKLQPGQAQYSCLPNAEGGIVDDLLVYYLEDGNYMLVVNASNIQKDWDWIQKHNTQQVECYEVSDQTSLLALQGPKALEVLQPLTDLNLQDMAYYTFAKGKVAGVPQVLVSNTGYTGSGGFEIYFYNKDAATIWDALMKSGAAHGIKPCGLAARDTLRLEMGFCLYGNDIDDTTSPLEAGLGWITKLQAGNNLFTGREAILALKAKGLSRRLVAFELLDRGVPRHDYPIADAQGTIIGKVTSGTMGPSVGKAIGMGYVDQGHTAEGSTIYVMVRNKPLAAQIVKLPFYKA